MAVARILIILHLVLGNIRFVVRAAAVMGRMPKYVSHVQGQNLLTSSMLCDVREIQGFTLYFVLCMRFLALARVEEHL